MHGVTRKRSAKGLKHTGNLFRENLQLTFYGRKIPGSKLLTDILVISKNGDRKMMVYHINE